MDLVLFGIQGSGKGTQGKKMAEKYNLEVFETGECLRRLAKEQSSLGQKVKAIIESGHLVSDEVVMEIIEDFMKRLAPGKNVLFDGIPRKVSQANLFDALLQRLNRDYVGVLIDISREEAIKRLTTRRICEKCKAVFPIFYKQVTCEKCGGKLITRADDNITSIENRLNVFTEETVPVLKRYEEENKMIKINGAQSIEKVMEDIFTALDKKMG